MYKSTMFEAGEKSPRWVLGFIDNLVSLTNAPDKVSRLVNLESTYILKTTVGLATGGISWKIADKNTGEDILDSYYLGFVEKQLDIPVLSGYDLTTPETTDPIFFNEGQIVKYIKYKGLDIMLIAKDFDIIDITDLNGNKLDSWEKVREVYPNDEAFNEYLDSDYCSGISLPVFEVKVFVNRWLNPKIDKIMEESGMSIHNYQNGIDVKLVIPDPHDLFDFDEAMDFAITYEAFCKLPEERPEIFETLAESYKALLP